MTWFLLAFDRVSGQIVQLLQFPASARDDAWSARDRLIGQYLSNPEIEVVLLGSKSEEDLRVTHARYFAKAA